jgi:hypothetical protein
MKNIINSILVLVGVVVLVSGGAFLTNKLTKSSKRNDQSKLSKVSAAKENIELLNNLHIESLNETIEEVAHTQKPLTLYEAQITQRTNKLNYVPKKFHQGQKIYQLKCQSCHGNVGQGSKVLANLSTRMSRRQVAYEAPPLLDKRAWKNNKTLFYSLASKQNSPHLATTGLEALDQEQIQALQQYVLYLTQ